MSATALDIMKSMKDILLLTDKIERIGVTLSEISKEIQGHDRQITRLESRLDTIIKFSPPCDMKAVRTKSQQ